MLSVTSRMIDDWHEDDFWGDVHARWLKLADGRDMPEREDFRPEAFSPYLGWLCFVSVLRDGEGGFDFLFRVGGTEIVSSLGYEVTGKSISTIEPPAYREEIRKHYAMAVEQAVPALFEMVFEVTEDMETMQRTASYQRMCLPFGRSGGEVTHLLNCSRGVSEIGEILRRYTGI